MFGELLSVTFRLAGCAVRVVEKTVEVISDRPSDHIASMILMAGSEFAEEAAKGKDVGDILRDGLENMHR